MDGASWKYPIFKWEIRRYFHNMEAKTVDVQSSVCLLFPRSWFSLGVCLSKVWQLCVCVAIVGEWNSPLTDQEVPEIAEMSLTGAPPDTSSSHLNNSGTENILVSFVSWDGFLEGVFDASWKELKNLPGITPPPFPLNSHLASVKLVILNTALPIFPQPR